MVDYGDSRRRCRERATHQCSTARAVDRSYRHVPHRNRTAPLSLSLRKLPSAKEMSLVSDCGRHLGTDVIGMLLDPPAVFDVHRVT